MLVIQETHQDRICILKLGKHNTLDRTLSQLTKCGIRFLTGDCVIDYKWYSIGALIFTPFIVSGRIGCLRLALDGDTLIQHIPSFVIPRELK
jgi:hypothetical protein